jgi:hypothetical protein
MELYVNKELEKEFGFTITNAGVQRTILTN